MDQGHRGYYGYLGYHECQRYYGYNAYLFPRV
jgi:hypothetical protein